MSSTPPPEHRGQQRPHASEPEEEAAPSLPPQYRHPELDFLHSQLKEIVPPAPNQMDLI
ncbi:hypothetical protein PENSUB_9667 [Penicillium subrubescens]|uniref:Uncharacterized protein n=1 Tax=Penicillium subrubescens TaxID=1316194 RepID=A0A1Q5TCZ7_9EURO|nr:hypothetical protein PENSUB_9667 [Penicillium subrubescens]